MTPFCQAMLGWVAGVVLLTTAPSFATAAEPQLWLDPRVQTLPSSKMGPFIRLEDGGILTVDDTSAFISKDEGSHWSAPVPMFPADQPFQISNERSILRTKDGTIVVAFMNLKTRSKGYWDVKTKGFVPDVRLDVWTVRSIDGAKTWTDAQLVQQGYAGAVRGLVQAENGNLVLATQDVLRDPARHVVTAYSSPDDGKTWAKATWVDQAGKRSPSLDLGGHGHHDGAVEPTVERLKDGTLWMLIRTARDRLWQAYSTDQGATWTNIGASPIAASAAPAMLKRLASGRLLLAWNQLYPEGKTSYERKGPDWHEKPTSYHREELSLALSDDDGKSWSPPVVIARQPGKWLSYPYVFERKPGEIWLTTMQGGLRFAIQEADILAGPKAGANE
ncbi:sialidase family protein [Singulisphaera sp. Ch08]|uniref:Sialidase family protein n=1 Tax=Singulisphaera sp. Ch08 TaxID=3120278 RepID=A0AAU7CJ17_9BACT